MSAGDRKVAGARVSRQREAHTGRLKSPEGVAWLVDRKVAGARVSRQREAHTGKAEKSERCGLAG